MPKIPISHHDELTGFYKSESGHLELLHRGQAVADLGPISALPIAAGRVLLSDGAKMVSALLSGDAAISASGVLTLKHGEKLVMQIPSSSGIDTDAVHGGLAGCDQLLDITQTEASAAFCKVFDTSAATKYRNIGEASAADFVQWQLLPQNTQDNDAVYFGSVSRFCQIALNLSATVSTYGGDALTWEYWDGAAWSALPLAYDHTDATAQDGKRSFGLDGAVTFVPPADWAATTVDSQSAFWIRARVSTVANLLILGILDGHRHYLCQPADGFRVPHACTISAIAIRDAAAAPHTTADIKLVLFNFTKGTQSGELTFDQDRRHQLWSPLGMGCDTGDLLGVLITQEDGANEAGPFTLELSIALI